MPTRINRSIAGWAALAALNCMLIVPWLGRLWPQPHDFGAFYTAAHICLHGDLSELYDLKLQSQTQKQLYDIPDNELSKRFLPYNHLPYEVVFFLPLANLSPDQALWIWRLESVCLLFFTTWLFATIFPMRCNAKWSYVIALAFFPVPFCLLMGQDTFVTLALFAVSLWLLKTKRNVLAGAALGLCLFKFQLVLPIIGILFLRHSWRIIVGFVASAALTVGISTLMVGRYGMLSLLRLWLGGETGAIVCISPLTMPNIRGLLTSVPGLTPPVVTIATIIISFLLLFVAAHQAKTTPTDTHVFPIAVCFVVLVSFHTNLYDLALLILPILVLLDTYAQSTPRPWVLRISIFLLFCTPLYLIVFVAHRVCLMAILVGLLWRALSVGLRKHATAASTVSARVPQFAAAHD